MLFLLSVPRYVTVLCSFGMKSAEVRGGNLKEAQVSLEIGTAGERRLLRQRKVPCNLLELARRWGAEEGAMAVFVVAALNRASRRAGVDDLRDLHRRAGNARVYVLMQKIHVELMCGSPEKLMGDMDRAAATSAGQGVYTVGRYRLNAVAPSRVTVS